MCKYTLGQKKLQKRFTFFIPRLSKFSTADPAPFLLSDRSVSRLLLLSREKAGVRMVAMKKERHHESQDPFKR